MKVSYEFADGTTFEVEVSDELGPMIISSRTAEESSDRKERRHCWSLDAILYEGTEYGKGHRPGWQHAPKRPAARQQPGLPGVKGRGEHARDRRGQQHDKGREEAQHAGRVHRAGAILMGSGRPVAVQRIRTGLIRQGAQRRDQRLERDDRKPPDRAPRTVLPYEPPIEKTYLKVTNDGTIFQTFGETIAVGGWFMPTTYSVGNTFCPLFNTRYGPGQPILYLSLLSGKPRIMLYDSTGTLILDKSVTPSFTLENAAWYFIACLIKPVAKTAQCILGSRSTGAGKTKWYDSTINKILRNEKYMGDALLQKTVTTDFLTKKRVRNTGALPQYYVEDDHEAIIPKEIFMQVQAELVRRRKVHTGPNGQKRIYSGNNCFSQMVVCGECGELYRRVHWNNHGCKSIVWRCISRLEPSRAAMNCTSRTVKEDLLQEVTFKAFNRILTDSDGFLRQMQENIAQAIMDTDTMSPGGIQARLDELQKELIRKANSKQDYDAIADEIFTLREQKSQSEADTRSREETRKRIAELQDFIGSQQSEITEFDESLVRKLIQQITVYDDHLAVRLKSGLEIDINE